MTKIISKLGMGRICLISFILLCSVFTSENSYSIIWSRQNAKVTFNQEANYISISFLFHQYSDSYGASGYLKSCEFFYSKNRNPYTRLLSVSTEDQKGNNRVSITMRKNNTEKVSCLTSEHHDFMTPLPHYKSVTVDVDAEISEKSHIKIKKASLCISWKLPDRVGQVNYFQVVGFWHADNQFQDIRINEVYPRDNIKLNTNTIENNPSELNSGVNDKVMVTGESDAINVTGAEPGENIRIYTASGVEVKSVVANDEVLNIKLPTNQLYIVKAGQARYKVAL